MGVFTFTAEKPKHSGYFFVIWEEGNSAEFLYINYSIIDGFECWKWGFHEEDANKSFPDQIKNPLWNKIFRNSIGGIRNK